MNRCRPALLFLPTLIMLAGCASNPIRLEPGEAVDIGVALRQGAAQLIEIETSLADSEGARLAITAGDVRLAPLDLPASEAGGNEILNSLMWSPTWPVRTPSLIQFHNQGPGALILQNVKLRRGKPGRLLARAEKAVPYPPVGWIDLEETLQSSGGEVEAGVPVHEQIADLRAWLVQNQRRKTFEQIEGVALAMRITSPPPSGAVEVKGRMLADRGAVVAFSRPDASEWKPLGPDWLPAADEALWKAIPARRPLRRGFESKDLIMTMAIFAGAPGSAGKAGLMAQLFRLDTTEAFTTRQWNGLAAGGQWLELKFDPPLEPGEYVLELRALSGSPAWLAWDREPEMTADSLFPQPTETLIVHRAPPGAEPNAALAIEVKVSGWGGPIERYAGPDRDPQPFDPPIQGNEMIFGTELSPGETEIFHLRDYDFGDSR